VKRELATPRTDWQTKCEAVGFDFHTTTDKQSYWNESACYAFTAAEIDTIEAATNELQRICLEAAAYVVRHEAYAEVGIAVQHESLVAESWRRQEPSLYGRFDLAFAGGNPKLLEYNADTPTSLLEASVVQWYWLKDTHADADQFNSLHERLIDRWREISPAEELIHFAGDTNSPEDVGNLRYLMDTACQANCSTALIAMRDIGIKPGADLFVDRNLNSIRRCFKLYPWEWMLAEVFGSQIERHSTRFIEPAWKSILSNKGILALLWKLNPGHPNLLPAFREPGQLNRAYVVKPVHSREGANIKIIGDVAAETGGTYDGPVVYQEYSPLFSSGGKSAVIGSWIIGSQAAGMGVREDDSLITGNTSRFVPHYFSQ
jgi:glutathionylspermidine synthase